MISFLRPNAAPESPSQAGTEADSVRQGAITSAKAGGGGDGELAKLERAAKEFEAVFLRQMLSALEKTTKVGDKGANIAGQQTYGSMIVDAVADAVASAGGIGLSSVLTQNLAGKLSVPVTAEAHNSAIPASRLVPAQANRSSGLPAMTVGTAIGENSPHGLSSPAVPRTEIRATASRQTGPQADRRIR